jgi:hypothetical protein
MVPHHNHMVDNVPGAAVHVMQGALLSNICFLQLTT